MVEVALVDNRRTSNGRLNFRQSIQITQIYLQLVNEWRQMVFKDQVMVSSLDLELRTALDVVAATNSKMNSIISRTKDLLMKK